MCDLRQVGLSLQLPAHTIKRVSDVIWNTKQIRELKSKAFASLSNLPIQGSFRKMLVARGRFELPSAGPEPAMIDRYTTGLLLGSVRKKFRLPNKCRTVIFIGGSVERKERIAKYLLH